MNKPDCYNGIFAKVASEYFMGKENMCFYAYFTYDEDSDRDHCYFEYICEEAINELRDLKEKFGEGGYLEHLYDAHPDDEEYWQVPNGERLLSIDIDNPKHNYAFGVHELHDSGLVAHKKRVFLTDEDYIHLLILCLHDSKMNFNKLKYADRALYDSIVSDIDDQYSDEGFYGGEYPYLVTLDEAMEDVAKILSEHPELKPKASWG